MATIMFESKRLIFENKVLFISTFLLGVFFMLIFRTIYDYTFPQVTINSLQDNEQIRAKGSGFTSPLLECSDINPLGVDLFSKLESKLKSVIPEHVDADGVEMSVYFRDLSNGGWLEAGSTDLYQPASLMKLPTLIAAYKKYDTTPEYFSEQVEVSMPFGKTATQNIITGKPSVEGEKITIEEIAKRTVIYSDNMAHDTLANNLGIVRIESVLDDFGVPTLTSVGEYMISPRIYARFLRILYNATYLSKSSSESLLKLLSESNFDKGIRAGVPKGILVASKFGERGIKVGNNTQYQLHDCGIVYAKRHYIICSMSKGPSFDLLYKKISNISSIVYNVMQ